MYIFQNDTFYDSYTAHSMQHFYTIKAVHVISGLLHCIVPSCIFNISSNTCTLWYFGNCG